MSGWSVKNPMSLAGHTVRRVSGTDLQVTVGGFWDGAGDQEAGDHGEHHEPGDGITMARPARIWNSRWRPIR